MSEKSPSQAIAGKEGKSTWRRPLFLGLTLALLASLFLLFLLAPPLIPSRAYNVNYSVNGIEYHDGSVYRAMVLDAKSYIYLPQVDVLYRYIGIDWGLRKAVVPGIYQEPIFGWACVHYDAPGVSLNNTKLENLWRIDFRSDSVELSDQLNPLSHQQLTVDVRKN